MIIYLRARGAVKIYCQRRCMRSSGTSLKDYRLVSLETITMKLVGGVNDA